MVTSCALACSHSFAALLARSPKIGIMKVTYDTVAALPSRSRQRLVVKIS
jgi:hypothetical protein